MLQHAVLRREHLRAIVRGEGSERKRQSLFKCSSGFVYLDKNGVKGLCQIGGGFASGIEVNHQGFARVKRRNPVKPEGLCQASQGCVRHWDGCELLVVIVEIILFVFPVISSLNPKKRASEPAISKTDEQENKPDTCL